MIAAFAIIFIVGALAVAIGHVSRRDLLGIDWRKTAGEDDCPPPVNPGSALRSIGLAQERAAKDATHSKLAAELGKPWPAREVRG